MRSALRLVLVALLTVPILAGWFLFEANRRIASKRQALATELPKLLAADEAQVVTLLKDPLFAPPRGDDAGPLLNNRLGWKDDEVGDLVAAKCKAALKKAGTGWPALTRDQLEGCDTGWLRDLGRFGRWSLTSGHRQNLASGPRTEFGIPNLGELQDGVKLHLLLAVDAEAAAQDVRHLARLVITHEYLMSTMIGFALLSIEEKAWERSGKGWSAPPLTKAEREFLRLHFFTAAFALNPLAPVALTNSTVQALPNFRLCMLETEQAFGRSRTELHPEEACSFEQARWELEHPYIQTPSERLEALSWPARAGAFIVKRAAPARYAELSGPLEEADALPAEGRWASRQSEFFDRVFGRR